MKLELTNLEKSIRALEKSIAVSNSDTASQNEDLRDTLQAGVIQNFEVAYEQCWKIIQRWLSANRSAVEADHPRTRKELFRLAARQGLISDPAVWFEYGDARNLTSHTYDEEQADNVFSTAVDFLPHALKLLETLRNMND